MCGRQITSERMQKDLHLCVWHLSLARLLLTRPSTTLCTNFLFHTTSGTQQETSPLLHILFLVFWHENSKYISQSLAISAASPSLATVISTVAFAKKKKKLKQKQTKNGAKETGKELPAWDSLSTQQKNRERRKQLCEIAFLLTITYLLLPPKGG